MQGSCRLRISAIRRLHHFACYSSYFERSSLEDVTAICVQEIIYRLGDASSRSSMYLPPCSFDNGTDISWVAGHLTCFSTVSCVPVSTDVRE